MGTLQDLNWEQFLLYMDMSSGKIISGGIPGRGARGQWGEQGWILASGLANYLGLTPVTCLESDSTGGVYLFESENQEQVRLYHPSGRGGVEAIPHLMTCRQPDLRVPSKGPARIQ